MTLASWMGTLGVISSGAAGVLDLSGQAQESHVLAARAGQDLLTGAKLLCFQSPWAEGQPGTSCTRYSSAEPGTG